MSGFEDLMRKLLWLPDPSATFAVRVDQLHFFVIIVTMIASVLTGLLAFVFFFKYRERRPRQSTPLVVPSVKFEIVVIGVPLFFFLAWFVQGYQDYVWYTTPPENAMDVYVMAKKWMWKFSYGGEGPNAIATLHVPANRPVRLLMTSRDVIHSFFVPDFRIKQDVIPGRYTETWFEATKPGHYQILCTQYCGTWHSQMWGEVVVMAGPEFDQWLLNQRKGLLSGRVDSGGDEGPAFHGSIVEYGKQVAMAQGCVKCHSLDGEPHIGPTWLDLYDKKETLDNGETVIADEAYLTDSMIDPRGKIVKGFKPVMPTYKGRLAAPDAAALVEFIKSLRTPGLEAVPSKEAIYEPVKPAQHR
ncbi:MAG TPA: cytochrome c oxidase subunit II [Polyangia bacterium]|jgi:cytochrome c oxidase subunit 2|nr:cytochrome c oxidase subunit II [Polyangia bacterium]